MGGIYITCGEFNGDDKSCSAIDGVMQDMDKGVGGFDGSLLDSLFHPGDEEAGIAFTLNPEDPERLLVSLWKLQAHYQAIFPGVTDWHKIIQLEESMGMNSTNGKYGESVGWRLYCVNDLLNAVKKFCETHDEIVLTFD